MKMLLIFQSFVKIGCESICTITMKTLHSLSNSNLHLNTYRFYGRNKNKTALPLVKNICSFQYSSSVRNFKSFWRSFNRSCLSKIHCKLKEGKIISATLCQHYIEHRLQGRSERAGDLYPSHRHLSSRCWRGLCYI